MSPEMEFDMETDPTGRNVTVVMYKGESKIAAINTEDYLINKFCSGTFVEIPETPYKVMVKDVILKKYRDPPDDVQVKEYRVFLKGELI